MKKIRVAYIGCGAVVERSHLPALMLETCYQVTLLVDFNSDQISKLAKMYNVPNTADSFDDHLDEFDLAVIATPSATHFELGKKLLGAGKHVLMEKPLACSELQAQQLVDMAKTANLILAVSLVRRYCAHFVLVKSLLDNQILGDISEFELEEGGPFGWPVQSASFFDQQKSGGGVLIDHGAHLLDACLWWFGKVETLYYSDDYQGGVEADCLLELTMSCGAKGSVRMSRLRSLKNRLKISASKASLEVDLASGAIELTMKGASTQLLGRAGTNNGSEVASTVELFQWQYQAISDLLLASSQGSNTATSQAVLGEQAIQSVALIEQCYAQRQSYSINHSEVNF